MLLSPDFVKKLLCWIAAILIPVVVILPVYFCTGRYASDCCAVIGVIYLAGLGLMFVGRQGTFDIFGYQFSNLIYSFKKNSPKKYRDVMHYKEVKQEYRMTHKLIWLPFLAVGVVLIVLAVIFSIYLI